MTFFCEKRCANNFIAKMITIKIDSVTRLLTGSIIRAIKPFRTSFNDQFFTVVNGELFIRETTSNQRIRVIRCYFYVSNKLYINRKCPMIFSMYRATSIQTGMCGKTSLHSINR